MIDDRAALAGANMLLGALYGMSEMTWADKVRRRLGLSDEMFERAEQLLVDRGIIIREPFGTTIMLVPTKEAFRLPDGFRMLNGDDVV